MRKPESSDIYGTMRFRLPWPPTINTYYRSVVVKGRPRVLISAKGRAFRRAVCALRPPDAPGEMDAFCGPLRMTLVARAPDNRKRDLDNLLKPIQDALCHAGAYHDDSQIHALAIRWGEKDRPDGHIAVKIETME